MVPKLSSLPPGSLMAVTGLGQLNIRTYNEYKLSVSDRLLGSIIRHTGQKKGMGIWEDGGEKVNSCEPG